MAKRRRKKKNEITLFTILSIPFKLLFCIIYIIVAPICTIINKLFGFIVSHMSKKDKKEKKRIRKRFKAKKYYRNGEIIDYDTLEGIEFEDFVADLLKRNGFARIKTTQASSDYGADIIAEADEIKYVFQCKNYSTPVGNSAVQEIFAAKAYYDADVAVVITNNFFTKNAVKLATKIGVELWDRDEVNYMVKVAMRNRG